LKISTDFQDCKEQKLYLFFCPFLTSRIELVFFSWWTLNWNFSKFDGCIDVKLHTVLWKLSIINFEWESYVQDSWKVIVLMYYEKATVPYITFLTSRCEFMIQFTSFRKVFLSLREQFSHQPLFILSSSLLHCCEPEKVIIWYSWLMWHFEVSFLFTTC
jgi:hypothetical protein